MRRENKDVGNGWPRICEEKEEDKKEEEEEEEKEEEERSDSLIMGS